LFVDEPVLHDDPFSLGQHIEQRIDPVPFSNQRLEVHRVRCDAIAPVVVIDVHTGWHVRRIVIVSGSL
jgi:hypothetical protein